MFECKKNCGECCGIVPIPRQTYEKHKHKIKKGIEERIGHNNEIYPISNDGFCVFLDENKKCMIYDDRPAVCRLYGIVQDLPCPYIKQNGKPRTETGIRTTTRRINKNADSMILELDKRFKKSTVVGVNV